MERPANSLLSDITEGVAHVFSDRFLRALMLVAAPLNFAVTGAVFTLTISLRQHGASASLVGVAQGIVGIGGLLGALSASWLQRRTSLRGLVIFSSWTLVACLAVASGFASHFVMVIPLAVGLFLAPAANAGLFSRLAATTPNHLQGRVVSVVMLAATTAASLAPVTTGVLIEHLNAATAMAICALAVGISSITATLSRGMRT